MIEQIEYFYSIELWKGMAKTQTQVQILIPKFTSYITLIVMLNLSFVIFKIKLIISSLQWMVRVKNTLYVKVYKLKLAPNRHPINISIPSNHLENHAF